MFRTVITAAVLYIATAVDLLCNTTNIFARQILERISRYLYRTIFRFCNFNISCLFPAFVLNYVRENGCWFIRF